MTKISKAMLMTVLALGLVAPATAVFAQAGPVAAQQAPASGGENSAPDAVVPAKKEEVKDESEEYRHSPTVIWLGKKLGMNKEQAATAFTLFNFAVLVCGLGFALLKILPKTFRKRSSEIQKALVDARSATEEATARLNSVEARLSKLDEQIAGYRAQAVEDSARDEKRIADSVAEEKAKIVAAAEAEIQTATTMARREIQQFAAELAIEQAARKLVVTAETDRLLVESFAHKLGADKADQN